MIFLSLFCILLHFLFNILLPYYRKTAARNMT
ncbi:unnamed protein product [Spirodela intermedia]|uniref:Uncharacterized protein n=1 Tax=Spirodela intermedia TaxID=51605 RepID=A0A7I8JDE4_SPIIN|nr:unnamed protein product [Spirodela intermedia]CAA6668176.1 unnamed protein product [Spirodela intermedia]